MNYDKLKRKDNICNLCQEVKKLTWDHVPPKGAIDLSDMLVQELTKLYLQKENPIQTSQNGLKFRTICRCCNTFLGKFDKAYKDLLIDIKQRINSELYLPKFFRIETYPVKIAKCILGHTLSARVDICKSEIDKLIRNYIFNDKALIPQNIRIFYWLYPYNCTIIQSDTVYYNIDYSSTCWFSILKTFPVAFAVTYDNTIINNARELIIEDNNINKKDFINFDSNIINEWNYPEKLSTSNMKLVSAKHTNILATPKLKK